MPSDEDDESELHKSARMFRVNMMTHALQAERRAAEARFQGMVMKWFTLLLLLWNLPVIYARGDSMDFLYWYTVVLCLWFAVNTLVIERAYTRAARGWMEARQKIMDDMNETLKKVGLQ